MRQQMEEKVTACNSFLKDIQIMTSWVTSASSRVQEGHHHVDQSYSYSAIDRKVKILCCYTYWPCSSSTCTLLFEPMQLMMTCKDRPYC